MLWFVAEGNTEETEDTGHRKVRSIFTFARQCNNREIQTHGKIVLPQKHSECFFF